MLLIELWLISLKRDERRRFGELCESKSVAKVVVDVGELILLSAQFSGQKNYSLIVENFESTFLAVMRDP